MLNRFFNITIKNGKIFLNGAPILYGPILSIIMDEKTQKYINMHIPESKNIMACPIDCNMHLGFIIKKGGEQPKENSYR